MKLFNSDSRAPSLKSLSQLENSPSTCAIDSSFSASSGSLPFEKANLTRAEKGASGIEETASSSASNCEGVESADGGWQRDADGFLNRGSATGLSNTPTLLASPLCTTGDTGGGASQSFRGRVCSSAASSDSRKRDCLLEKEGSEVRNKAQLLGKDLDTREGESSSAVSSTSSPPVQKNPPCPKEESFSSSSEERLRNSKVPASSASVASAAFLADEEPSSSREGPWPGNVGSESVPASPSSFCETPSAPSPPTTRRRGRPVRRAAVNSMRRFSEDFGADASVSCAPRSVESKGMPGVKFSVSRKAFIARWSEENRERWKTFPLKNYKGPQEAFMDAKEWRCTKVRERLEKLIKATPSVPAASPTHSLTDTPVQSLTGSDSAAPSGRRDQSAYQSAASSVPYRNGNVELETGESAFFPLHPSSSGGSETVVVSKQGAATLHGGKSFQSSATLTAGEAFLPSCAEARLKRRNFERVLEETVAEAQTVGEAADESQRSVPARRQKRQRAKPLSQQSVSRVCSAEGLLNEECLDDAIQTRMRADELGRELLQRLLPRFAVKVDEEISAGEQERSSEPVFKDIFQLCSAADTGDQRSNARVAPSSEGRSENPSATLPLDFLESRGGISRPTENRHLLLQDLPRGRLAGMATERSRSSAPCLVSDVSRLRNGDSSRSVMGFHGPGSLEAGRSLREEHGGLSHSSVMAVPLMELRKLLNKLLENIFCTCIPKIPDGEDRHKYLYAVSKIIVAITETDTSSNLGPLLGLFAGIIPGGGEPSQQPKEVQVYILNALVELVSIFG